MSSDTANLLREHVENVAALLKEEKPDRKETDEGAESPTDNDNKRP